MKKIFLLFTVACVVASCDPTHEKISNDGHITIEELKAKSTVTVDKADNGKNGNVITCNTSAPVNAKWTIDGKDFLSNYARKKMKVERDEDGHYKDTPYKVYLNALCADGTVLRDSFEVNCQDITDELQKFWIYGENPTEQPPFVLASGDAGAGRFSDTEGKYLPYLSDEVYFGLKTLIFEITDAQEGPYIWGEGTGLTMRIMNGWWNPTFADDVVPKVGLWELPITDEIAKSCAKGGDGKDLDLLMTRGQITIKSVYYEE
jgi:hypothetical protein